MEMDVDFDSETPPSSPVIGYSAPVTKVANSDDECSFQCKGPIRAHDNTFSPQGLLATGELISAIKCLNKSGSFDHPDELEITTHSRFFNFPFDQKRPTIKTFIRMCRKNIYALEHVIRAHERGDHLTESDPDLEGQPKPWHLRRDVVNFLSFALKSDLSKERRFPGLFHGLRRSLEKMEAWPVTLKHHSGFEGGNKCTSPYYHFFHLQLELRWFFLILTNVQLEVLNWVLDDLVHLAWFKYVTQRMSEWSPKVQGKVPFNCYCVQELWTMIKHLVDEVKPLGKEFWDVLTSAIGRFTKSPDPLFPLWLVSNLVPLGNYNFKGEWTPNGEQNNECYEYVRELVKSCLASKISIAGISYLTSKLLPIWGADDGLVQIMWGHWASKIEKITGVEDNSYWKSPDKWASLIKCLVNTNEEDEVHEDFFHFIRFFCGHVRFYPRCRKIQKLTNMIYLKLPDSKVSNFNEIGLLRLSCLHLASVAASHEEDTLVISKNVVNSFKTLYNVFMKKGKHVQSRCILTAESTLYLLLLEKSVDISQISASFMEHIGALMLKESKMQMDPKKREMVMIYMELLDCLPKYSTTKDVGQSTLLSSNFRIWLTSATPDYLNRTFRTFHQLLSWQRRTLTCPDLVQNILNFEDFIRNCALNSLKNLVDIEPLAELAADFTILFRSQGKIVTSQQFYENFALEVKVHPEISQLYIEKLISISGDQISLVTDNLKLLQTWVRLICTGVTVPRKFTAEVLHDEPGELFGHTNDSLLELFCQQASVHPDWERKDVEDILKCLTDLCQYNWNPIKDNRRMLEATINSSKIILTKLKFTKLYSPRLTTVASRILDFYTRLLVSLTDDVSGIWFKYLPEVFQAVTTSYTIWENDAYLKRQVQIMVTTAFLGFSSNDYLQRNTENHPSVKIMRISIDSDNTTVLEEILPNLKFTPSDKRPNPSQDYLKTLLIFTRRAVNLVQPIIYSLPLILRIIRTSGTMSELPTCTELICSLLNPALNSSISPVVLAMKIKDAFRTEMESNMSLNYRKYFKLFSSMTHFKGSFRNQVQSFMKDELADLVREQIKLCERQRGTGHNDTLWKCFYMFEAELDRSAVGIVNNNSF